MNNETTNRAATAATSPLTVKEAPQPVMVKKIGTALQSISAKRARKP